MAIIECIIFFLKLNYSTCDKYEPKRDDIAPSVQVSHYDCSEMTENNFYSLNQVEPCNMAPQRFQMNEVKQTIYTPNTSELRSMQQFAESNIKGTNLFAECMIILVWTSNNHK